MSESTGTTDITIVGGGLVGASLALMLSRARPELAIVLLEAKPIDDGGRALPSFDERTTAISPSSQEVFIKLGLWPGLAAYASPIERIHVSDQGSFGMIELGPVDNHGKPLGFVVKNRGFGEVLTAALRQSPVSVRAPVSALSVAPKAHGVAVRTSDDRAFSTRLLVIADGAQSPLRTQLGIAATNHDYEQYAFVTSVQHSLPHQRSAYERFSARGPLALLPLSDCEGCASGLVWALPAGELEAWRNQTDAALLGQLQQQFGYRLGRFSALGARHFYPLSLCEAREQVRSNIVLMGNAAHFLHPVAGQGFNLAMRDNLRLSEVLKHTPQAELGSLATLNQYWAAQQQDQRATVFLSHNFNRLFGVNRPGASSLRAAGFWLLDTVPPLKHELLLALSGRASAKAEPWS